MLELSKTLKGDIPVPVIHDIAQKSEYIPFLLNVFNSICPRPLASTFRNVSIHFIQQSLMEYTKKKEENLRQRTQSIQYSLNASKIVH